MEAIDDAEDFGEEMSDVSESEDDASSDGDKEDEEEDDDEGSEFGDDMGATADAFAAAIEEGRKNTKKRKTKEAFSLIRGLDFKNVGTVLNVDMPLTLRAYVHRVGRTARGRSDGVALSLVERHDDEQVATLRRLDECFQRLFCGQSEEDYLLAMESRLEAQLAAMDRGEACDRQDDDLLLGNYKPPPAVAPGWSESAADTTKEVDVKE